MALIDSYRISKIAKQKQLAKLTSDKAKEFVKLSNLNKKNTLCIQYNKTDKKY